MAMTLAAPAEHDQRAASNTWPADWLNPTPLGRYNLVVIGGGKAGIAAALTAAGLQARVALVQPHRPADDPPETGHVSNRPLLDAARAAYQASRFGIEPADAPWVDFDRTRERLRRSQADMNRHDSVWRLTGWGVDVYLGAARFVGPRTIEVDGTQLQFDRAILATGSRPAKPNLPGLDDVGYQTNDTISSLANLPRTLVVIGGGPSSCELAQAFRRFGSDVHLLVHEDGILLNEDRQAAALIQAQLEHEGIRIQTGAKLIAVGKTGRSKSVVVERQGSKQELIADEILLALGREPHVNDLGLDAAAVRFSARGIEVNARWQTSNPAIFATADVCSSFQLVNAAEAMARVCVTNALFYGRKKLSQLAVPRCTYTDPELAHVGLTPRQADEQGLDLDSYRVELGGSEPTAVDGATDDGNPPGFVVLHTRHGGNHVVGATIVAAQAGEMIGQVSLLMARRLPISAFSDMMPCSGAESEAFGARPTNIFAAGSRRGSKACSTAGSAGAASRCLRPPGSRPSPASLKITVPGDERTRTRPLLDFTHRAADAAKMRQGLQIRLERSVVRYRGVITSLMVVALVGQLLAPRSLAEPNTTAPPKSSGKSTKIPPPLTHYKGREIAQTMHYLGADWLVRDSRQREEDCQLLLKALNIQPGQTVCDMGCGNGFYTLQMAQLVGPTGRVYAVDVQNEMLHMLSERARQEKIRNIKPLLGTLVDPKLPVGQLDLLLLVDVYHEFSHPEEMLQAIRKSLKPHGRLALAEFRLEDPDVPIKLLHKMSKEQILKELPPNGFKLVEQFDGLPWQHLMFFEPVEEKPQ